MDMIMSCPRLPSTCDSFGAGLFASSASNSETTRASDIDETPVEAPEVEVPLVVSYETETEAEAEAETNVETGTENGLGIESRLIPVNGRESRPKNGLKMSPVLTQEEIDEKKERNKISIKKSREKKKVKEKEKLKLRNTLLLKVKTLTEERNRLSLPVIVLPIHGHVPEQEVQQPRIKKRGKATDDAIRVKRKQERNKVAQTRSRERKKHQERALEQEIVLLTQSVDQLEYSLKVDRDHVEVDDQIRELTEENSQKKAQLKSLEYELVVVKAGVKRVKASSSLITLSSPSSSTDATSSGS